VRIVFLWLVLGSFYTATAALAVYGLHLYALLFLFCRKAARVRREQRAILETVPEKHGGDAWPIVTTQIPIYNEREVAERVLQAAAEMDYPRGRHEIQVLDDSDDATRGLIDDAAAQLRGRGVEVMVIRRGTRAGFKAGALAYGLERARGEYVAVFDADFVPPRDFLKHAVVLLENQSDLACLQGRWSHLNRHESWLTEAQALGIDGHFAIEQGARAWNGLMMNFNGTGGVWRRAAIEDPKVGGWSADTLTEDLDLSYRAQLAGWKLDYCLDLPCPAELPGTIRALKSQQRRWAAGSIQVARKLLPRIWRAKISLREKVEATLHLTHYSVAVWMLLLAVVARPMLGVISDAAAFPDWFWAAWVGIMISAIAPSLTYTYARYTLEGRWSGLATIPSMLVLGCGMCVNNTLGVIRGLVRFGGEFVRTPKSGSADQATVIGNYQAAVSHTWAMELILGVYALFSFVMYFLKDHRLFSLFLLLYSMGFLTVGWMSRPPRRKRPQPAGDAPPSPLLRTSVPQAETAGA
jgi:cellulose synthase/poly-beta-1,6-N-acetylglucosamine synthase-like glycosyltransferase